MEKHDHLAPGAGRQADLSPLFQHLRQTSEGEDLCQRLETGHQNYLHLQDKLHTTYLRFCHTELQQYIDDPKSDAATRIRAIYIQERLVSYLQEINRNVEKIKAKGENFSAHSLFSQLPLSRPHTLEPPLAKWTSGLQEFPGDSAGTDPIRDGEPNPRHNDLTQLQETMSQRLHQVMDKNLDFIAHLDMVQAALKAAKNHNDIEELRQILLDGTEELITGHKQLNSQLHSTESSLEAAQARSLDINTEIQKMRRTSHLDEFTGIPNRTAFIRRLEAETVRAHRHGYPLALAIIDLDEFENINGHFGREAGDEILRCYAKEVLAQFRAYDMVARYGAEEFSVLLPNTGRDQALRALHKAQERAANTTYLSAGKKHPLPSFSAGIAWYLAGEPPATFIRRANQALHRAKSSGSGRIETT